MSDPTQAPNSFWDKEDAVEKENQGGSGWFCKFKVDFGFKIFPPRPEEGEPQLSPADTFFSFNPLDDLAKENANKAAKKAVVDLGLSTKPLYGVQITMFVSTIYGRTHNFKNDNTNFFPSFGDDYKNIVKPSLKNFDLTPGEYWGHLAYQTVPRVKEENPKRPYRESDFDENGELKPKFVLYVDAKYPDQATMISASGLPPVSASADAGSADFACPPGFKTDEWASVVPDIVKLLQSGKKAALVAKDYGVEIGYINKVAADNGL